MRSASSPWAATWASCASAWAKRRASRSRKRKPGMEREGITAWDFGELPEQVTFRRGNQAMTGYPALVDEGASVSIRLFDTPRPRRRGASRRREASPGLRIEGAAAQPRSRPRRASIAIALKFQATIAGRQAQGRPHRSDRRPRLRRRGCPAAHGEGLRGAEEARQGAAAGGERRRAAPPAPPSWMRASSTARRWRSTLPSGAWCRT